MRKLRIALITVTVISGLAALTFYFLILPGTWSCDMTQTTLTEFKVREAFMAPLFKFRMDTGRFPSTEEGLIALAQGEGIENWKGPYIESMEDLKDAWGRELRYRYPGQHNKSNYDLFSLGEDGVESEDDPNNWSEN